MTLSLSEATQAPTPAVQVTNLCFKYAGGVVAVGDVSFSVASGEIVAIIGPSGCGKSTLLRVLAGLADPTGGRIARNFDAAGQHGCSMLFQEDTLLPWLRVRDNVGLYYRFRRRRAAEIRNEVSRLLKMVGLEEASDYYPSQLSGGMKRRVAMLAAIAPEPQLLLLDEPFAALDEPTRIGIHGDLYRLVKKVGTSAVLVTHDLSEAITLSDRILMLSRAPATIVAEYEVPLGEQRDMFHLRTQPAFLDLYARLWNQLTLQIPAASRGSQGATTSAERV